MSEKTTYFLKNTAGYSIVPEPRRDASDFFTDFRIRAAEHYSRLGFPDTKHEDWKYTNVLPWLKKLNVIHTEIEKKNHATVTPMPDIKTIKLVVEKGTNNALKLVDKLPNGLHILSFDQALEEKHPAFIEYFGSLTNLDDHFSAANSTLFEQGIFIYVEDGFCLDRPLHILNSMAENQSGFSAIRLLIVIGANAKTAIIESFIDSGFNGYCFTSTLTEIIVGAGSQVEHYVLNNRSASMASVYNLEVKQKENSSYDNYNFSFSGSPFLRNSLHVIMDGKFAQTKLFGLYYATGNELLDNHTCIEHLHSDCNSDQKYKGLINQSATAVFNGKVIVHPNAQRSNAYQQNNNLILDDRASIYSKPELEIFADDVKCSHGATLGNIDQSALFYLLSRGIKEKKAEEMLTEAFAQDIINAVPQNDLRDYIGDLFRRSQNAVIRVLK